MKTSTCTNCQKSKANFTCGLCQSDFCKSCVQVLADDAFLFMKPLPAKFAHSFYCYACYDKDVMPFADSYAKTLQLAKDVNIFFKNQGKETRTFKRKEKPVVVVDCQDYDEAVLRLAFLAVELGYNTVIDVHLKPKKVFTSGYQTTVWSGSGIPTQTSIR